MYIGITLLYSYEDNSKFWGVLKSYVIWCEEKRKFLEIVNKKVVEQSTCYPDYEYLGIEDVFSVSGDVLPGEILGRSTFYDMNLLSEANQLVNTNLMIGSKNKQTDKYYSGSLVYFYDDNADSYTFTVLVISYGMSNEEVINNLEKQSVDKRLVYKIAKNAKEHMSVDKIKYLGVEAIYEIKENLKLGGSYYVLYNDEYRSRDELKMVLPSDSEIMEIINDVFIVPNDSSQE